MKRADRRSDGRTWLAAGALAGLLAVVGGALASHALAGLPAERAAWVDTGLRYQMLHSAALLAVGILARAERARLLDLAGAAFVAGLLLFSGLLYARGLGAPAWTSRIVPVGGLSYMAGWVALLAFALKTRRRAG